MCLKNNIGTRNTNKLIWKEAKDETTFPTTFRGVSLLQSYLFFSRLPYLWAGLHEASDNGKPDKVLPRRH